MNTPSGASLERSRRLIFGLIAAIILSIGIAFRCWNIGVEPLWLDEAYSVYAAGKGFEFLWTIVPRYETHPPFYYSLLRIWTLIAGDGLLGVRSLGLVAGLLTLAAIMLPAREITRMLGLDRRLGLIYAAAVLSFAAVSPMLVDMTREVRPYPILILAYTLAIFALFRLRANGGHPAGRAYGLYLLLLALILWLHNLGVLFAFSLGLALLVLCAGRHWRSRDWAFLIAGHALVLAIWLPALLILADQAPSWVQSTWLKFVPRSVPRLLSILYLRYDFLILVSGLGALVIAAMALLRMPAGSRILSALMILAVLPVAMSLAISFYVAPVFIIRTMTPVAVPVLLLLPAAVLYPAWPVRWAGLIALIVTVAIMFQSDVNRRRHGAMEKWDQAIDWLAPRYRPADIIYAYPNEGALPFDRALRDKGLAIRSIPIPSAVPAFNPPPGSWYVSGSRGVPSLDAQHLQQIASDPVSQKAPTIWLLRMGPWAYDKGDHFLHALQRDRITIGHFRRGAIDLVELRRKDLSPVPPPEQAKP